MLKNRISRQGAHGLKLLQSRVVVVTGKGGVGKTTTSAALALAAAKQGKRALVVETHGNNAIASIFGLSGRSYQPRRAAPGVETLSITADEALEDYILLRIKVRTIYKLVFRNRVMGPFLSAVPGLHDLVHLGKVYHLEQQRERSGAPRWDIIIVDAPATGHGLTMLDSPDSMMEMTAAGPFHESAKLVRDLFWDRQRTSIALVSLPNELVVNETRELHDRLGRYRSQVRGLFLNEVHPRPFEHPGDWGAAREHAERLQPGISALGDEALLREALQERAFSALDAIAPIRATPLPFLFDRQLDAAKISALAEALEAM